jgi:hypothetical protein
VDEPSRLPTARQVKLNSSQSPSGQQSFGSSCAWCAGPNPPRFDGGLQAIRQSFSFTHHDVEVQWCQFGTKERGCQSHKNNLPKPPPVTSAESQTQYRLNFSQLCETTSTIPQSRTSRVNSLGPDMNAIDCITDVLVFRPWAWTRYKPEQLPS